MQYRLLLFVVLSFGVSLLAAQQGIRGVALDDTGNPLIGGNVAVYLDNNLVQGTTTDFDGRFQMTLDTGIYRLELSYVGYSVLRVETVEVLPGVFTQQTLQMREAVTLDEVAVVAYKVPPMRRDETTQGTTLSRADVKQLGTRNTSAIASVGAGSTSANKRAAIKAERVASGVSKREARQLYRERLQRNREDYGKWVENSFTLPQNEPLSTFGADVDVAAYANVRRMLQMGQLPPADAVRTEEFVNYFAYDYAQPKGNAPAAFTTTLAACPWNTDHRLLRIGVQAREIATDKLPASNLVFLLDVSGSMNSADKLPLLKQGFRLLVEQLRPQDTVSIVVYAGAAGTVLEPTSGADKTTILDALDRLNAGGSTAGAAGIKLAYQLAEQNFKADGNNRIILATDGDFNVGTTDNGSLEDYVDAKRKTGVFLSVLGFGSGNYQDARMQTLAENGNGNASYIDNLLEAQKVFVQEFGGTLHTVAKDVKLQVEFNPAYVGAYRLIGYESRLLNPEDFNDDTKDAGDMGSGHTVTALYELIPAGVESSFLPKVEKLRYQQKVESTTGTGATNGEWATVRMKYKAPKAAKSQPKVESVVRPSRASDDAEFAWASAVTAWSLMLKESAYLPEGFGYDELLPLAKAGQGTDTKGYRAEAIRLMELGRSLAEERELELVGQR